MMLRTAFRCAVPVLLSLLAGCASPGVPADIPAVITDADAASRAELKGIVQTAMNGAPVMLAPDALTDSSTLSIERSAPRGIGAPPATGRMLGRPDMFRLVLDGPQCVLIHDQTGLRWLLMETRCRPE